MPSRTANRDLKAARFWVCVKIVDGVHPHVRSRCWEFQGPRDTDGYGKYGYSRAHRVAWTLVYGALRRGDHVLHRCDNPVCCNPTHLFLGDNRINQADMIAKGRGRAPRGTEHGQHKLTEADVLAIRADTRVQREIAADYGVSRSLISLIRNRQNWRHLS